MDVRSLDIPGVRLITPRRFEDSRGFFQQNYHQNEYRDAGIDTNFIQDNWSRSSRGILRGLHYQAHFPQAKLVSVVRGAVFDVAVDLRKDSPTFGRWVGAELSEENGCQLFIPRGFAHGFLVLSDIVDFFYKCDEFYHPEDDCGIRWNDPQIGIKWPDIGTDYVLSSKDKTLPFLSDPNTKLF